ncbi:MAG: hypothetical protein IT326_10650 [Anaerolineae bacterium]|nr:hypothetical protein [Anaerolineae bacterium]
MHDEQLQHALRAIRTGNLREARRILGQAVNEDPSNAAAWWLLASAIEDTEQRRQCLLQVLRLKPDHVEAHVMLEKLEEQRFKMTPPGGLHLPVIDTTTADGGLLVIREEQAQLPARGTNTVGVREREHRRVRTEVLVGAMMVTIVLCALLGAGFIFMAGRMGIGTASTPAAPVMVRALGFDPPECTDTPVAASTILFVNASGTAVEVLRGPLNAEESLFVLAPMEQNVVEATPAQQIRYVARAVDASFAQGGAIIEVPVGSACQSIIR